MCYVAGNHWHNSKVMVALGPCTQLFTHENPKSRWGASIEPVTLDILSDLSAYTAAVSINISRL
jgi:hypothetical protein